jgi:Flp pilus assembly protein TadG
MKRLLGECWTPRRGAVGPLTALMLVPLVGMVAFAVDLGNVWRIEIELQNAADAAALAAVGKLVQPTLTMTTADPPLTSTETSALWAQATADAVATAQRYGGYHHAGAAGVVINSSDVVVGYIADPSAPPDTPAGQMQTGPNSPFPNSVQVTARRDHTVSSGPIPLYFAAVFGWTEINNQKTATASVRGGVINGFKGAHSGLLPIAMYESVYLWLVKDPSLTTPPPGVVDQDLFTVDLSGTVPPPGNVTARPDKKREARVYTEPTGNTTPGNFGLLNLDNSRSSASSSVISDWILNGVSAEVLATWGANGLRATAEQPLAMGGQTGLQASQEDVLRAIIGQQRIMPVFRTVGNPGSNAVYQIIGFVGITIVEVNLTTGPTRRRVVVQVTGAIDAAAVIEPGGTSGSAKWVLQGVSLSR